MFIGNVEVKGLARLAPMAGISNAPYRIVARECGSALTTSEEIDAILSRHNAIAIVVGHTVTGTVGWLDGDKRLVGIDVRWDTDGEGQGLLISEGKQVRLTMTEVNATLEVISTSSH